MFKFIFLLFGLISFSLAEAKTTSCDIFLKSGASSFVQAPIRKQNLSGMNSRLAHRLKTARIVVANKQRALRKNLVANPEVSSLREFDTVIVGGGFTAAVMAQSISTTNQLTISQAGAASIFSELGDQFFGNSPESLDRPHIQSPNFMPGFTNQIGQYIDGSWHKDGADDYYWPANVVGAVIEINLSTTNSSMLRDHVVHVEFNPNSTGKTDLFLITTASGEKFVSQTAVVGTGMGQKQFNFADQASNAWAWQQQKINPADRTLWFIDDLFRYSQALKNSGKDLLAQLAGEEIIVIGGGDGGAISTMKFRGEGPESGYLFDFPPKTLPIVHWVGTKASTADQYDKGTFGPYRRLTKHFPQSDSAEYSGGVIPYGVRANSVTPITINGKKKVKVQLSDGRTVIGAIAVTATGYSSPVFSILEKIWDGVNYQFIKSDEDPNLNIAVQPIQNGKPIEGVYIAGAAAALFKGYLDETSPGGVFSPRMQVHGPRIQSLGRRILKEQTSVCSRCRSISLTADDKLSKISLPLPSSEPSSNPILFKNIKSLITQSINSVGIMGSIENFTLSFRRTTTGLEVRAKGINSEDFKLYADRILNDEIKSMFAEVSTQFANTVLEFSIQKKNGVFQIVEATKKATQMSAHYNRNNAGGSGNFPIFNSSDVISLSSSEGTRISAYTQRNKQFRRELINALNTQPMPDSICEITSVCTLLRARGEIFSEEAITEVAHLIKPLTRNGELPSFTLIELAKFYNELGLNADITTVRHDVRGFEKFKASVESAAKGEIDLVVNYHSPFPGRNSGFRVTPVAAYSASSKAVLMAEADGYNYEPFWIPIDLLWKALKGKGYLTIAK